MDYISLPELGQLIFPIFHFSPISSEQFLLIDLIYGLNLLVGQFFAIPVRNFFLLYILSTLMHPNNRTHLEKCTFWLTSPFQVKWFYCYCNGSDWGNRIA